MENASRARQRPVVPSVNEGVGEDDFEVRQPILELYELQIAVGARKAFAVSPGAPWPLGTRRTSIAWAAFAKPWEPALAPLDAHPPQPKSAECTRYQTSHAAEASPVSLICSASMGRFLPTVPATAPSLTRSCHPMLET